MEIHTSPQSRYDARYFMSYNFNLFLFFQNNNRAVITISVNRRIRQQLLFSTQTNYKNKYSRRAYKGYEYYVRVCVVGVVLLTNV